jgi:hypothetical protein
LNLIPPILLILSTTFERTYLVSGSADFPRELAKQLESLEASCHAFDAGNLGESVSIARSLRGIFHRTETSLSILAQLGASGTNVLSTAGKRPAALPKGFWPPLIQMGWNLQTNVFWCAPSFATRPDAHRMVPTTAWWDGEVVFVSPGKRFKRKQLVLHAASKDEGAGAGDSLPAAYGWLINGADVGTGIRLPDGSEVENISPNPHIAYLRQMGFEVLRSPELLKLAGR